MNSRPTLGEFVDRCQREFDCRLFELRGLFGPKGEAPGRYLSRTNGRLRQAVLPEMDDDELIPAAVLSSLCNRLGIPAHEFGLFIG